MTRQNGLALLGVAALLAASVASAASSSPPPPRPAPRPISQLIAELRTKPYARTFLASARYAAEVFGAESSEGNAEDTIQARGCGPLTPAELKAASALLAEYPHDLAPSLRAYTLGQQGKIKMAVTLYTELIGRLHAEVAKACPGETPSLSDSRAGRAKLFLQCIQRLAPTRKVTKQQKELLDLEHCARSNSAR